LTIYVLAAILGKRSKTTRLFSRMIPGDSPQKYELVFERGLGPARMPKEENTAPCAWLLDLLK
jgi:hypothetical protein